MSGQSPSYPLDAMQRMTDPSTLGRAKVKISARRKHAHDHPGSLSFGWSYHLRRRWQETYSSEPRSHYDTGLVAIRKR